MESRGRSPDVSLPCGVIVTGDGGTTSSGGVIDIGERVTRFRLNIVCFVYMLVQIGNGVSRGCGTIVTDGTVGYWRAARRELRLRHPGLFLRETNRIPRVRRRY